VKSVDVDAILAFKERQLATVDYSTDFLDDKSINVKGRSPKVA
jgi:hypothetical protein